MTYEFLPVLVEKGTNIAYKMEELRKIFPQEFLTMMKNMDIKNISQKVPEIKHFDIHTIEEVFGIILKSNGIVLCKSQREQKLFACIFNAII